MTNRRTFIKRSGFVAAGLLLGNDLCAGGRKQSVGLQMYTLREVINAGNVAEVMSKVAGIGFKELEVFGYTGRDKFWGKEPKAFKALLKANGLKAPSAHIAFENFLTGKDENEFRLTCEAAAVVGNKFLVIAWLPEQYRKTPEDYKKIALQLNKAAIISRQYGLRLAYHNHDFEFTKMENGVTGYDIILKDTDDKLVQLELDLYWAVKAGIDPVQLFEKYPGRFPLWHIKDMDKASGSFTEVGSGSINFSQIMAHKKTAGLQHFFIEQDEIKKDVFESIQQSFDYVNKNLVS